MSIKDALMNIKWDLVSTLSTDTYPEKLFPFDDLDLSQQAKQYLQTFFPDGLYLHQRKAVEGYLVGQHVCLATRTASGKSAAFYIAGINELVNSPHANIIAIYPTRALGDEQQNRWQSAINQSGLDVKVGRIDGSVRPTSRRMQILKESQVIICTPDILHAWFLSHLNEKIVLEFLRETSLIVVDEVHTYTGVFGSNSAFLFRRLRHLMNLLGKSPRFIVASATIANPEKHLESLFGLHFSVIGESDDTSPRYPLEIHLVNPPRMADFLTEIVALLKELSTLDNSRFITFVDSRKQVELISSILSRRREAQDGDVETDDPVGFDSDILSSLKVLPYRAGYEEQDRRIIQERLANEDLKGVVSTSGLELGIDIPHLNVCVLIGIPQSSTSFYQRIGRVGRDEKGYVIVVNTDDAYSRSIFAKPESLLARPLGESALYLENEYIQYIHALCLARLDGEHDQVYKGKNENDFSSAISWPKQFIDLCRMERLGQVPKRLQSMKAESGDSPNYTFPLRDVESQFQILYQQGPNRSPLGSVSYSQLMREAYPGAVYYYATQPYRVYRIKRRAREVLVRKEKRYTTKPQKIPTLVFPNFIDENVLNSSAYGDAIFVECNLQIRESINGIRERRGPNESTYQYPLSNELGFYFDKNFFTRNYFTTGVVITHPIFRQYKPELKILSELLYEVFLLLVPFERQDINQSTDKHRVDIAPRIGKGDPFIAIYDQTYGSLRLTSRLMQNRVIKNLFVGAYQLAKEMEYTDEAPNLLLMLRVLAEECQKDAVRISFDTVRPNAELNNSSDQVKKVILPGSKGLNLNRDNELFFVSRVFFTRDGLRYEGETETFTKHRNKTASYPLVDDIVEIPGVSKMGYYNYLTGEVEPIEQTVEFDTNPPEQVQRRVESEKLKFVLTSYFSDGQLYILSNEIGIEYAVLDGAEKSEKVASIVTYAESNGLTRDLLEAAYKLAMNLYGDK